MTRDFDDIVTDWMQGQSQSIGLILSVIYGVRSNDDITNEVAETFLTDCLKEGMKNLEDRASQILEMDRLVNGEDKE